ncbi:unnamed protein product [Symbiodinium natans]|uniref:Uncharacterized protein n=1 Tax=Symbiodinium natans TaxID=878477 RepID=A0A812SZX3_9DINO|nr:unnamed protein product [Symbiodinium natans]
MVKMIFPRWHLYPIRSGEFAVEDDRDRCGRVVQAALSKYISELREKKDEVPFRLYLSLFEEMVGLPIKRRNVEDFLKEFHFSPPLQQHKGFGPMACAALSGDHDLVLALAHANASLHTHAPGMRETLNQPHFTPLHLVLWFKSQDLRVLETLLELRADPNSSTIHAWPALMGCRTVESLELMVRYGGDVNTPGKTLFRNRPIHNMTSFGPPCEVVAKLVELRANLHGSTEGLSSMSPFCALATQGDCSPNDLRIAQLFIDSKADINQRLQPEGMSRAMEMVGRAYCRFSRGDPGILARFFKDCSTTGLGWCAILNNDGLLTFLLHARADPEIRNNRGLRPIDFAASERIRSILQDPTPHFLVLEHEAEIFSQSF